MSGPYARQWSIPASRSGRSVLLSDLETVLRLAPQWDLKSLSVKAPVNQGMEFHLDVEHDRTEQPISFVGKVEELVIGKGLTLKLDASHQALLFSVRLSESITETKISFRIEADPYPSPEDLREYDLWARCVVNYLRISRSRSPFTWAWKWFLDRFWLQMTQSGKRIVFFIVLSEGFSLLLLVALLICWKYFPGLW